MQLSSTAQTNILHITQAILQSCIDYGFQENDDLAPSQGMRLFHREVPDCVTHTVSRCVNDYQKQLSLITAYCVGENIDTVLETSTTVEVIQPIQQQAIDTTSSVIMIQHHHFGDLIADITIEKVGEGENTSMTFLSGSQKPLPDHLGSTWALEEGVVDPSISQEHIDVLTMKLLEYAQNNIASFSNG